MSCRSRFGNRHSVAVKREMQKDNIMMVLFLVGGFVYCLSSKYNIMKQFIARND